MAKLNKPRKERFLREDPQGRTLEIIRNIDTGEQEVRFFEPRTEPRKTRQSPATKPAPRAQAPEPKDAAAEGDDADRNPEGVEPEGDDEDDNLEGVDPEGDAAEGDVDEGQQAEVSPASLTRPRRAARASRTIRVKESAPETGEDA
ncbi:hypothetical protein [Arthrobacter woluwensis]|uniref:hypothetical protein n=1 Tax=Arthrobacter woluwensis TaxID=156980 RepID=UPI003827CBFC